MSEPEFGPYARLREGIAGRLVAWLRARLPATEVRRVLEAGSGSASGTILWRRDPERFAMALDLDPAPLLVARRRAPGLSAVVGDLARLPFRPGTLDLVWSSSTFEEIERQDEAIAEARRVLRHGGWFFVGVPAREGPLRIQPWIAGTRFGRWLGPVWRERDLRARLASCGFLPRDSTRYFLRVFVGVLARKS